MRSAFIVSVAERRGSQPFCRKGTSKRLIRRAAKFEEVGGAFFGYNGRFILLAADKSSAKEKIYRIAQSVSICLR